MNDMKDTFQTGKQEEVPSAGFYKAPQASRNDKDKSILPILPGSKILLNPQVQQSFDSYGLDGLKSILLQELLKLDFDDVEPELIVLAQASAEHQMIKRALRATKLMAAQWMEDKFQKPEIKEKCEYIFHLVPTFGTANLAAKQPPLATVPENLFPDLAEWQAGHIPAECTCTIEKGTSLVFVSDLQGNYDKLEKLLLTCQMGVKPETLLHWSGAKDVYLVLVGDLLSKSPLSSWGDRVGFQSYEVISSLRRMMEQSRGHIKICYGSYDLDIATGAVFHHPMSGFMGQTLGVNAQVQSYPIVLSFIKGLQQLEPDHAEYPWEQALTTVPAYKLRSPYGTLKLLLPARAADGLPEITPLVNFYQQLFQYAMQPNVALRPKTIAQIDQKAAQLVPPPRADLNLDALKTAKGRALHFEGLMQGSGTLDFLRHQIAGIHIFSAGEKDIFACHADIQENTLDMLEHIKNQDQWQPQDPVLWLAYSQVLRQRQIPVDKIMELLDKLKLEHVTDWLALPEKQFYQLLLKHNQLNAWVPSIIPQRDEKSFVQSYQQFRWEMINEDPSGLTGYAINLEGLPRRGEPVMRKIGELDERTRRSYGQKFLHEIFREELDFRVDVLPAGEIVAHWPAMGEPEFLISLLIDESVAIYKDANDKLHMPIKHAAWIEYN